MDSVVSLMRFDGQRHIILKKNNIFVGDKKTMAFQSKHTGRNAAKQKQTAWRSILIAGIVAAFILSHLKCPSFTF